VSADGGLNVTRLARALALIGPVDVDDSMIGWNAYAADIACAYGSTDTDDDAPSWQAHDHRWIDPDKTDTFCRDCGDVRKDDGNVRLTLRADRPLYPGDPELGRLRALELAIVEYLASSGMHGLYDAGRMISAMNTVYLLLGRTGDVESTHAAFIPDDIEAMGAVMARVAGTLR
jgi:hypothetical protein